MKMQKIKVRIKEVTVKINVLGIIVAMLLIGGLAFYINGDRECIKVSSMEEYGAEAASISEQDGKMEVSWEFKSAYRYMQSVMIGLHNASEYAGKEIIITLDNNAGVYQTQEYVIPGQEYAENCGMGLIELVGKGRNCKLSVYGDADVIANVAYGVVCYEHYDMLVLLPLFLCCLLFFLNFGVRLEGDKKWCKWVKKGYKMISLVSIPMLLVYVMEYMSGSIGALKTHVLIANMVICACLYLVVFMLTNRLRFSVLFTSCMVYVLAMAEYFVLLFRGSPILPYDVASFQTAMSVVGQYRVEWNEKLIFSTFVFVAVISTACRMSFKIQGHKRRVRFAAFGAGIVASMLLLFYGFLYETWGLSYSTWAPKDTYMEDGYLMSTMVFAKYATIHKPEGYSVKKAREILASFESTEESKEIQKPINLIVVMNESWSTLDYVSHVETNMAYDTFYQSMSDNTIKGNIYVSICGGNTAQTEYEFFTGNSVSMLPSGATAYEFFVNKNTRSICDSLKQENYTCLAIHPFGASGYNRDKAYERFGFDEFITQEAFEGYDTIRSFYSDEATYEKVIELYENKNPGENLFVWDLTMQNHGGYVTDSDFEKEVFLTDYPRLDQAAAYLTLMKYTDEALEKLITYFEEVEEPTMIVMFGDHQPALSDGTYDVLYGMDENEVEEEEREKRYITPFLIWNNYGLQEDYIEQMSANYLSAYVFQQAGFSPTAYQNLLMNLYQYYPVINAQGVYDAQGKYWSWEEVKDSSNYEKIHDYQVVEYYMIKNGKE